jgi:hypothetical protein
MADRKSRSRELKPLNVSCTSSDCDNGLHCFRKSRRMSEADRGRCRSCGRDLVEWGRVHKRELADASYTFEALKYEHVRHHFWHTPIDQRAVNHARRKGRIELKESARKRLQKSIGTKTGFDGRQTPYEGNIIYYAQHALACCCRACMEYWHGIPRDAELTDEQIDYFVELVMMYVDERMPDLAESGEKIPFIRTKKLGGLKIEGVH